MQEYDVALKQLLRASADSVLRQVGGNVRVKRWLEVEFQKVETPRADLLGATAEGDLIHIELQSSNASDMAVRMAECSIAILRKFRKIPKQIVLYAGQRKLRMKSGFSGPDPANPDLSFRYAMVDFRNLESEPLLASQHIEDNLLAILARLQDQAATVRQILMRIATLQEAERRVALAQFLIISGLRRLGKTIQEEVQSMPILNDILDHDLLGPAILQGREEGLQKGRQEGRQEGRHEMVLHLIEKRFGPVPARIDARLRKLPAAELDDIAVRLFQVTSIEKIFSRQS